MDDVVNRFARELADAIAAAVADDPKVEACREKARAAGFEMRVTLDAVVGFISRSNAECGDESPDARRRVVPGSPVSCDDRQRPPLPPFAAHRRGRLEERGSRIDRRFQTEPRADCERGRFSPPSAFLPPDPPRTRSTQI